MAHIEMSKFRPAMLLGVVALTSALLASPAMAQDHRHHHHDNGLHRGQYMGVHRGHDHSHNAALEESQRRQRERLRLYRENLRFKTKAAHDKQAANARERARLNAIKAAQRHHTTHH
jgi:hypothetical protein